MTFSGTALRGEQPPVLLQAQCVAPAGLRPVTGAGAVPRTPYRHGQKGSLVCLSTAGYSPPMMSRMVPLTVVSQDVGVTKRLVTLSAR